MRMFKYRLYPTKVEEAKLEYHLEICRQTYNNLLGLCKDSYRESGQTLRQFILQNKIPILKKLNPCLGEVYSQVLQNVSKRIADAYTVFFSRKKLGLRSGLPRFKKARKYNSLTYPQSGFSIKEDRLQLSKIGSIKIRLHRTIQGKVKNVTVKRSLSGKWFAFFASEIEAKLVEHPVKAVGIDVGLEKFAALSDGVVIENPRYYRKEESKLGKIQRSLSRKKRGSQNKQKARIKVARLHEKIENRRIDFLHKASRTIAKTYRTIYIEDLRIGNMIRNRHLSKSISDAGWGIFLKLLSAKSSDSGGRVVPVDPKHTSQRCSACGTIVKKALSERMHICPECGLTLDRDLNASKNILKVGLERAELTPVETEGSTPHIERQLSVVEAGSPHDLSVGSSQDYRKKGG